MRAASRPEVEPGAAQLSRGIEACLEAWILRRNDAGDRGVIDCDRRGCLTAGNEQQRRSGSARDKASHRVLL